MENNIYAPPTSSLQAQGDNSRQQTAQFYVVSPRKFITLYLVTMGLYRIYWMYKNWAMYRDATGEDISPVARSIFAVFFWHELLGNVSRSIAGLGIEDSWNPKMHASLIVGFSIVASLQQFVTKAMQPIESLAITWSFLALIAFLVFRAQLKINIACNDASGSSNDTFNRTNILWIILGLLIWSLNIVGAVTLLMRH